MRTTAKNEKRATCIEFLPQPQDQLGALFRAFARFHTPATA
jgi:hypothetical protein